MALLKLWYSLNFNFEIAMFPKKSNKFLASSPVGVVWTLIHVASLDVKMAPLVAAIADGHVTSARRSYALGADSLDEEDLEAEYFDL